MEAFHNSDQYSVEDEKVAPSTAHTTELEALARFALVGGAYVWVGYVAALVLPLVLIGLMLTGNPFRAFGREAAIAVALAIGAAVWSGATFVGTRGRISLPALACWGGATLGTSFAIGGPGDTLEFTFGALLGTSLAFGGKLGATVAVGKLDLAERLARSTRRQFATMDLLALMAIVAVNLLALRVYLWWFELTWSAAGWWMVSSVCCALVAILGIMVTRILARLLKCS